MIQLADSLFSPALIPGRPALERLLHELHVDRVGAVLHTDDFADVGAGGQRVGQRARVDEANAMSPGVELEGGGHAEDPGAYYGDVSRHNQQVFESAVL